MLIPSSRGEVEDARQQRGIQSIEVGGRLLLALAAAGRPMALKELAQAAGMTPPKAHPYLVSFGKLGLIAQEGGSGRYALGPLAMQIGLISLQQYEPLRLATARLPELARQFGHLVAIAVWGNHGPTIVRTEAPPVPLYVDMRHGSVMSLRGTATGRLFAAFLPPPRVQEALAAEPADAAADDAFRREVEATRRSGLAHAVDSVLAGVGALAAPVFDAEGALVLGLTVIGPGATLDTRADGAAARRLQQVAAELTAQLGGRPAARERAP
ncbi:MAG TPA: IclR family transcriptional regulator C-terminal domain-containing protein [Rubrivivax sp.]|nr:helix-turn-helix domain-containing protein [Burkholderiales bacterium]HNT39525.1 IclR family transcriptional regulator C-terminal domain-containing protein [Rubrivivax sp.]